MKKSITFIIFISILALTSCATKSKDSSFVEESSPLFGPIFSEDSAMNFCAMQCNFGPRTMNSKAHEECKQWISAKFKSYGLDVIEQKAQLKGYNGTTLKSTNIIAQYKPSLENRILICAHWDSRPWADNDPDSTKWQTPVMAANDGASGVGVMLELARVIGDSLNLGVDFICFDAEDWGTPQWEENDDQDSWALGAQYWSKNLHKEGYKPKYGILLDMVGGVGAHFLREINSDNVARDVVDLVWQSAEETGYGSFFIQNIGASIVDDHLPVIKNAGIPCIDIIPCYRDCEQSVFGPTWHTVNDDMNHLDKNTLKAVGQTLIQTLWKEQEQNKK